MDINYGDLIRIGDHMLLCGDATKQEDVDRLLNGVKVQLALVDPPYGCQAIEKAESFGGKRGRHKVILNDDITKEPDYQQFTEKWLNCLKPHMAERNSVYVFCMDKMIFPIRAAFETTGFRFTQLLIWLKTHAVVGRMDYLPMTEMIVYGWCGKHGFYKAKDKNVLVYPKPSKSVGHGTIKPRGLLRRMIMNSSKVGDVVYDGYLGSGSTMQAAHECARICYGIEIDIDHCKTIVKNMETLTGLKASKVA